MDVALSGLRPHPRNYNRHSDEQIGRLAESLRKFGQPKEIVTWGGFIIAGHGLVEAARRLKWPTLRANDMTGVWSEAQALAFMGTDNELARLADPDEAALAALVASLTDVDAELAALAAGTEERLAELLKATGAGAAGEDPGPQVDKAEELQRKWQVATGDLWELGAHRLICGDCTERATVERVMGGERAQVLFTSPPYAQQRDYTAASDLSDWDGLMQGAFGAAICADDCQVLVNLGLVHRDGEWWPYWDGWIEWMRQQGWRRFGWYVWDQGAGLPGDWAGRLAPSFEFVFHFNKKAVKPVKWTESVMTGQIADHRTFRHSDGRLKPFTRNGVAYGDTKIADSVIRVNRQIGDTGHPAPFSEAFSGSVIQSWPGAIIYEPFSGSGTTLIACEKLGRRCRAIEIEPRYCAVALERWATMTGKTPVRVGAG